MGSKTGARREERDRQSKTNNSIATIGSIMIGLLLFVLPRTGNWIIADLSLAFALSLYCVWHCWSLPVTLSKRVGFLILHLGAVSLLAYFVWPRIVVSPSRIAFAGYSGETFNLSVRNERSDDVYDVQIPFHIGHDKHFEDKLSAKIVSDGEPPEAITNDYDYCYGKGKDVHKIMPHEQEVFIVRIRHIAPSESRVFSITYAGGEKLETKAEESSFLSEPYSYSTSQGTFGVRGDYRIRKFSMHADRLEHN